MLWNCSNTTNNGKESSLSTSLSVIDSCDITTCAKDYILTECRGLIDYSEHDGCTPKDGFVPTPAIAVKIAEIALYNIYGKEKIEKQKPFLVRLENDIWTIEGQFHPPKSDIPNTYTRGNVTYNADGTILYIATGGNAYIEISKNDGAILKVVHTK